MGRLEGKVALITGASSGLGRATASRFIREGARVVLGDVDAKGGAEVLAELPAELRANAFFQPLDVTREEDCQAAVDAAVQRWGQLDIALANAGRMVRNLGEARLQKVLSILDRSSTGFGTNGRGTPRVQRPRQPREKTRETPQKRDDSESDAA